MKLEALPEDMRLDLLVQTALNYKRRIVLSKYVTEVNGDSESDDDGVFSNDSTY